MSELIAVALITILATISPGPDFAMVTRNSYLYGRKAGVLSALGIACGVQIHVFYTMFGVGFVIDHSPTLFTAIKLVGALYLIYIGWKTFRNRSSLQINLQAASPMSTMTMFSNGFLTNALNPKTTLFVVSTYTQVVNPDTALTTQFGYGLFMSATHFLWFAIVALLISCPTLRTRLLTQQRRVDTCIGIVLVGLGIALSLSQMPG
ncbi:RhtB (resistance to homoserine/threonine) family protein [Herbaspirillum sp. Sphag1AN]|uniref:LysE family translocator n=1 Tax=unclassified Herbaspirillum TaxID=2624150 RepID=UPI001618A1CD|nr:MULTISPECIES: LysE family translocator [unclassified Herbaspirillum]MBB3212437.1 RhtB (resistance to homoserine/threonine) family protein [Herbaspirillum sp. Sphag1AN]MBB3245464.1 RhtB (resistance to homoserine/threonine) family protein [Herbaspirillum sp. Sphag64]